MCYTMQLLKKIKQKNPPPFLLEIPSIFFGNPNLTNFFFVVVFNGSPIYIVDSFSLGDI